jgi:hypothetical protein
MRSTGTGGRRAGFRVMDALIIILAVIAVVVVFYVGLRAYSRRQVTQGHRSSDID